MDDPRVSELLTLGRRIWADQPSMELPHVAVAACTVTGDIARISRDELEGDGDRAALGRELGNLILSGVRWASDLGFDPAECVAAAAEAQRRYVESRASERRDVGKSPPAGRDSAGTSER
ncbi:hypothetical protein [Actinomadura roseirufa]|uniref:hypothetical protein n=1 Tax=Actinomadura roseirufa TaxID=2094049 RepID=UPI0010412ABA|nr:hypothetical protein [Actinomadura roseirufa]